MPVTLVDRLPLPNLKVYTAGSVSLLSIAVYYALSVTSDPNWRVNATQGRLDAMAEPDEGEKLTMAAAPVLAGNGTRNVSEQFVDVMTFMMQEPLCMWTLINIAYCSLAVFGFGVQRLVFGQLRVAEAQRVKDKFWNYVFYKFIFVFGVINVQYMDEVLLWCSWFTLVGFLHLLGQLCKDRYEYLSSSPNTGGWAHVRLASLLGGILVAATALLGAAAAWGLPAGRDTFAFMAAECILVLVSVLHVVARYVLQMYECDVAGPVAYYTHLVFDSVCLVVELVHVVHMVVYSNMLVSMASLVLLMQLRHLLHELQARVRRHRLYTSLATHMSRNYPMASKEEVEKNQDNCAICWEPMKEARKLPCSHLFHNSCLCQWVQQDASCPTCRRALAAAQRHHDPPPARHPNHLFHFDGSRYVSWLPSFSVEVTRVRGEVVGAGPVPAPGAGPGAGPGGAALAGAAAQLQHMFPQYSLAALAADLARTASADLTLDNILEGRLAPPTPEPPAPPAPPALQDVATSTVEPWRAPADLPSTSSAATATLDRENRGTGHRRIEPEHFDSDDDAGSSSGFSCSAVEREVLLARRKARLVASARRRYLERAASSAARAASPAPPAPAHS
ncbi:E3 ubiquitin-protein ligase AMFR-like [Anticarsia gemmatalis]|uniref:E3 ubiquitin-protein ligase AMFR-like n=1 Tax=Anticarsia gemmatalis TaxID=129554 RepID=UPI003F76E9E7